MIHYVKDTRTFSIEMTGAGIYFKLKYKVL